LTIFSAVPGAFFRASHFYKSSGITKKMRACFLGQNVCALGFGVAILQTPPLAPAEPEGEGDKPPPRMTPIRTGDDISTGQTLGSVALAPPSREAVPLAH
jgi:hypothetical protein